MTVNQSIVMLLCMIMGHIIADYNLQGCLAELKQKAWWQKQLDSKLEDTIYKNDWAIALFMHSFAWTFCVLFPTMFMGMYNHMIVILALLIIDTGLHFYIDDLKANKMEINLIQDQGYHLLQIICMWGVCCCVLQYI